MQQSPLARPAPCTADGETVDLGSEAAAGCAPSTRQLPSPAPQTFTCSSPSSCSSGLQTAQLSSSNWCRRRRWSQHQERALLSYAFEKLAHPVGNDAPSNAAALAQPQNPYANLCCDLLMELLGLDFYFTSFQLRNSFFSVPYAGTRLPTSHLGLPKGGK